MLEVFKGKDSIKLKENVNQWEKENKSHIDVTHHSSMVHPITGEYITTVWYEEKYHQNF